MLKITNLNSGRSKSQSTVQLFMNMTKQDYSQKKKRIFFRSLFDLRKKT